MASFSGYELLLKTFWWSANPLKLLNSFRGSMRAVGIYQCPKIWSMQRLFACYLILHEVLMTSFSGYELLLMTSRWSVDGVSDCIGLCGSPAFCRPEAEDFIG